MVYIKSSSACEYFDYDNDKEKGSEKLDYIYANGKIWSEVVTSESTKNTYYHHTDHFGTTVCITDSTGKLIWECEKDAFGNVLSKTNSNFVLNFTGKLLDENTNLYYFNARWYDSDIGSFISEDPIRDGMNWYGYVGCNPMVYVDRIGLFYYTAEGQQSSNNNKQTDTVKSETPSGMPQNQTPNITGRGPSGVPMDVSPSPNITSENLQGKKDTCNINVSDNQKKQLRQFSLGIRAALIIGGSFSLGVIINPNNIWDSGLKVQVGVGVGVEVGVETPFNESAYKFIDNALGVATSTLDFTEPTSTIEIEGSSDMIYASAGVGMAFDMKDNSITGVEIGSIGGGVYKENTQVFTIGEVVECIYNTGVIVLNGLLKSSGMSKFYQFKMIELDGR